MTDLEHQKVIDITLRDLGDAIADARNAGLAIFVGQNMTLDQLYVRVSRKYETLNLEL